MTNAFSQEVLVDMPQERGYIGIPMKFVVVYKDVSGDAEPSLPPIDGFVIRKRNGSETSSQTSFVNGRVSSTSTSKYTFFLTPTKLGELTIPAMTFIADGKAFQTIERKITVIETPTSGALKAEINGTNGDLYLGQPVDLTLRILIEQFKDTQLGVELSPNDMFSLLSQNSQFGCFEESIRDGRANVRTIQGHTDDGFPTTFYEYSVKATAWPETTGPLSLDPIAIVADYPISLGIQRTRGFFGGDSLVVEQSKLIRASTKMPIIEVLTPPLPNQPTWFTGAVGLFDFRIVAEPTHVNVGEPITLTMRITDLSSGPVNLDYLSATALDRFPTLTNNFKVPDKPLGGTVQGRTKTFTQTIRPRKDNITEIPSLPMSSFDPKTGEYITTWTKAIPITVNAVETVSANDLIGGSIEKSSQITPLTEVDGGILANYTGDSILRSQNTELNGLLFFIISLPPSVCLAIIIIVIIKRRSNTEHSKQKAIMKNALQTIRTVKAASNKDEVQQIAQALRAIEPNVEQKDTVKTLLQRCNAAQFGGLQDEQLAHDVNAFAEAIS